VWIGVSPPASNPKSRPPNQQWGPLIKFSRAQETMGPQKTTLLRQTPGETVSGLETDRKKPTGAPTGP